MYEPLTATKTLRQTGIFEIIRNSDSAIRSRLQLEKILEHRQLLLCDSLGSDAGQFLANLQRSHVGRGTIEEFSLLLEKLRTKFDLVERKSLGLR